MKPRSLVILHFNTFEYYPPVLNFINDLISDKPYYFVSIFSTSNETVFQKKDYESVSVCRFGILSNKSFIRYLSYFLFNLFSTIILLINRPTTIIVYETLSVFPAFFYSRIFKKVNIHIHYHEYTSLSEQINASYYMKILYKCEYLLLRNFTCSHTNEDRKLLFLIDNPKLSSVNVEVYPNLPPSHWWFKFGKFKNLFNYDKIKLVYVGALDFETMYLKEILDFVKANPDALELTLFCHNLTDKIKDKIIGYSAPNVFLKKPIVYDKLPQELVKYDIGLVLYKGHIPNYVYNVPNKVYEYLSCGLHVIVDKSLITTINLGIEQIGVVDYKKLDTRFLKLLLLNIPKKEPEYSRMPKLVNKL